jgi:hypothetical protein
MQASDPITQAAALHRPSSETHLGRTEQHQHPELCHLALSHPHPQIRRLQVEEESAYSSKIRIKKKGQYHPIRNKSALGDLVHD